jgi:protein-S-isoprenylcysteine O-methyltransferase Ste14
VFVYWLMFVLNDPLELGFFNTLDSATKAVPCTTFDQSALIRNVASFVLIWWLPHSGLARRVVKQAIGTWQSVYDRPLFAFIAPLSWLATLILWTPIDTCATPTPVLALPAWRLAIHGSVFAVWSVVLLGLFFLLPSHVFGTDRCKWASGKPPAVKGGHAILTSFPYGVVRHPAAAAFLWYYWAVLPTHTANHWLLASLWTLFIVVGTLIFEEGGLRGADEFGDKYRAYARHVNAFYPSVWSLKKLVGLKVPSICDTKLQ